MINFFIHVFYFLNAYYKRDRINAFFGLCLLLSLNLMAVSWTFDLHIMERFITGDPLRDRWVIIPLVTLPILLGIYGYYRLNKNKVENMMNELANNEAFRKKQKTKVVIYISLTVFLWVLAIFIPPLQLL